MLAIDEIAEASTRSPNSRMGSWTCPPSTPRYLTQTQDQFRFWWLEIKFSTYQSGCFLGASNTRERCCLKNLGWFLKIQINSDGWTSRFTLPVNLLEFNCSVWRAIFFEKSGIVPAQRKSILMAGPQLWVHTNSPVNLLLYRFSSCRAVFLLKSGTGPKSTTKVRRIGFKSDGWTPFRNS